MKKNGTPIQIATPNPELLSGLLLLDKPSGVTSYDCVHRVKKALGISRVGHCGTLDPAATGLLLLLIGTATRRQESFLSFEKEYVFRAEFGKKTSTADLEGSILEEKPHNHITLEHLISALKYFEGQIQQTPPIYSALKYKGKPYYAYARKGIEIPRFPREVSIHALSLLSYTSPFWEGRVVCSRGTYIRTLVEDIAERLNTCATLVHLVRERIGPYRRSDALSLERIHDEEIRRHLRNV